MTPIAKLDAVLNYLSDQYIKNDVPLRTGIIAEDVGKIYAELNTEDFKVEITPIINKFVTDGFLDFIVVGNSQRIFSLNYNGYLFYSDGGYTKKNKKEKYEKQLAVDEKTSVIKTNYLTKVNMGLTLIFAIIVTFIQIKSCRNEDQKELKELKKQEQDSIQSVERKLSDSQLNQRLTDIYHALKDTTKSRPVESADP
jgi:hypothetical protein